MSNRSVTNREAVLAGLMPFPLVVSHLSRVAATLSTETNSLNLKLMKIKMPVQTVPSRSSGLRSNFIVKPQGVFAFILAVTALLGLPAHATNVFLKTSDAAGTSSVTGSTNWSNGAVPSSGNTYFTTNTSGVGLQMRGLLNRY